MGKTFDKGQGVERREEILAFITKHCAEKGYAPSLREIADAVGLSSVNGAREHVQILLARGELTKTPGVYRSLRPAVRASA